MFNILSEKRTESSPKAMFQSVRFRHKLFIRRLGAVVFTHGDLEFDEFDLADTIPVSVANRHGEFLAIGMPFNGSFPAKDSWRNTRRLVIEKTGFATQACGADWFNAFPMLDNEQIFKKPTSKFIAPRHSKRSKTSELYHSRSKSLRKLHRTWPRFARLRLAKNVP